MSHHSSMPPMDSEPSKEAERELHAAMKLLLGEYPDGKLNVQDEGAIALSIGEETGKVVIRFPKPVAWIGFTPQQALEIAETLIYHARKCGGPVPLVLRVGSEKP